MGARRCERGVREPTRGEELGSAVSALGEPGRALQARLGGNECRRRYSERQPAKTLRTRWWEWTSVYQWNATCGSVRHLGATARMRARQDTCGCCCCRSDCKRMGPLGATVVSRSVRRIGTNAAYVALQPSVRRRRCGEAARGVTM